MNDLFVKKIVLEREKIPDFNVYPFNISVVKNFFELFFNAPVTFLVGENGAGKSTFIEAIAMCLKLNPEGGTQNFNFNTLNTHSILSNYITLHKSGMLPKTKYFLRAESFYNVASEIIHNSETSGCGPYMVLMAEIYTNASMVNLFLKWYKTVLQRKDFIFWMNQRQRYLQAVR